MIDLEQTRRDSIREIKHLDKIKLIDEETEPWIVIDKKNDKVRVTLNQYKMYRCLDNKNLIQQSLDMLLVDTINDLLKNLADREEASEKELLKHGGVKKNGKVRDNRRTKSDTTDTGLSGTSGRTDNKSGRFV